MWDEIEDAVVRPTVNDINQSENEYGERKDRVKMRTESGIVFFALILFLILNSFHPFFLDKKGRKSQGKTNRSARFSEPRAHHHSEMNLVNFKSSQMNQSENEDGERKVRVRMRTRAE